MRPPEPKRTNLHEKDGAPGSAENVSAVVQRVFRAKRTYLHEKCDYPDTLLSVCNVAPAIPAAAFLQRCTASRCSLPRRPSLPLGACRQCRCANAPTGPAEKLIGADHSYAELVPAMPAGCRARPITGVAVVARRPLQAC